MTKANVDVNSLTSLEDIQAAYDALSTEEETVVEELDSIVSSGFNLDQRLVTIANMVPDLDRVSEDCSQLDQRISVTCGLAEKVSFKVRQLDLAKTRVAECQQRVHDLIDLKLCSEGVVTALNEEDYEKAAAHIHRFLAMDESLLSCKPTSAGSGAGRLLASRVTSQHCTRPRPGSRVSWPGGLTRPSRTRTWRASRGSSNCSRFSGCMRRG